MAIYHGSLPFMAFSSRTKMNLGALERNVIVPEVVGEPESRSVGFEG